MYEIRRAVWFALYAATFVATLVMSLMSVADWLWVTSLGAFVLYAVLTSPASRNRVERCDCRWCARLTSRRTDAKDPA